MVGWHQRLDAREFEQAPGDPEGQGGLARCSPRGRRVGQGLVTEEAPEEPVVGMEPVAAGFSTAWNF